MHESIKITSDGLENLPEIRVVNEHSHPDPEIEWTWHRNLLAKVAMVGELSEMGLSIGAIARVLHLEEGIVLDHLQEDTQKCSSSQGKVMIRRRTKKNGAVP